MPEHNPHIPEYMTATPVLRQSPPDIPLFLPAFLSALLTLSPFNLPKNSAIFTHTSFIPCSSYLKICLISTSSYFFKYFLYFIFRRKPAPAARHRTQRPNHPAYQAGQPLCFQCSFVFDSLLAAWLITNIQKSKSSGFRFSLKTKKESIEKSSVFNAFQRPRDDLNVRPIA